MTQFIAASILDAALITVRDQSSLLHICSAAPVNYSALGALSLATTPVANNDFTLGFGTGNARTLTLSARANITATTAGTATHIVLANPATQTILLISACASQAISPATPFSLSAFSMVATPAA
jgi:hypothetical protein